MKNLHKFIQLMLEFFKGPFLVLHFSYNTFTTFLTMLSVILLSMLMILLSIPLVISHVICGKNYNHFHNILRLFDVLPNFPFTTSETMHDGYL